MIQLQLINNTNGFQSDICSISSIYFFFHCSPLFQHVSGFKDQQLPMKKGPRQAVSVLSSSESFDKFLLVVDLPEVIYLFIYDVQVVNDYLILLKCSCFGSSSYKVKSDDFIKVLLGVTHLSTEQITRLVKTN